MVSCRNYPFTFFFTSFCLSKRGEVLRGLEPVFFEILTVGTDSVAGRGSDSFAFNVETGSSTFKSGTAGNSSVTRAGTKGLGSGVAGISIRGAISVTLDGAVSLTERRIRRLRKPANKPGRSDLIFWEASSSGFKGRSGDGDDD